MGLFRNKRIAIPDKQAGQNPRQVWGMKEKRGELGGAVMNSKCVGGSWREKCGGFSVVELWPRGWGKHLSLLQESQPRARSHPGKGEVGSSHWVSDGPSGRVGSAPWRSFQPRY